MNPAAWLSRFQPGQTSVGRRVEIAVLGVALTTTLNLLLRNWDERWPYWFPFLLVCTGSAWVGGRVAGWTAVVLSTLSCDYFFNLPFYSLAVDPDEMPYFIAFAVAMVIGNWFGSWRRSTEGAVRDRLRSEVSSRKQAELERRIAELRWQAVFDTSAMGMVVAGQDGRILAANRRFCQLTGSDGAEPVGRTLGESLAGVDGTPAPVGELLAGRRRNLQFEVRRPQGPGGDAWLRIHVEAVAGTADFPLFVTAFCEDISERKQAEEQLLAARSELAHAARLTTIGELTASIAHEVNQPLSAIVTNGNAALRWLAGAAPRLDEARNTVNWIMRDARRASEVIARIRALTRKSEPHWTSLDFNELVRESLELAHNELSRRHIQVQTALDPALPAIQGERVQLQQVLLNLVLNAIEAMAAIDDRPRALLLGTAASGGEPPGIAVEVRDSGSGVAAADFDKLFNAFFTTKPEGTGLGLWISRSIIEAHSGALTAQANPGHGMCFRISLPCEQAEADSRAIVGEDFRGA